MGDTSIMWFRRDLRVRDLPALAQAAADHHWEITTRPLVRWLTAPQLPPRIGAGQLRPVARVARSAGFTGALGIMRALGLRWPAL